MAQVVALIMIAQVASGGATSGGVTSGGVTSVRVGEFLSMGACKTAAAHAVFVGPAATTQIGFECVPLSPVSDADNRR